MTTSETLSCGVTNSATNGKRSNSVEKRGTAARSLDAAFVHATVRAVQSTTSNPSGNRTPCS